jgi:hypothetical protein
MRLTHAAVELHVHGELNNTLPTGKTMAQRIRAGRNG